MSIIIILMGVLVPALNRVRRFSKIVTQRGQFHEISKGLELFRNDHQESYPDSSAVSTDSTNTVLVGYCGAMKMCEALLGQDGMGFHPLSSFRADGTRTEPNGSVVDLYRFDLCTQTDPVNYQPEDVANMQERIKYVDVENFRANRLQDLYTWSVTNGIRFYPDQEAFQGDPTVYPNAIISDVFLRADIKAVSCAGRVGQKAGMPVLYYKADPSKLIHDVNTPPNAGTPNQNIYNFDDNRAITMLGCPWESAMGANPHPMYSDPRVFLKQITNTKITATPKPHNEDGYILVSAGWDGLYGTRDDVFNFAD